ncbi:MAG: hypothetical protein M0T84_18515 [Betaproteobacteria bacterium]|nr:hypothetical protein [Betaproteobacteria bacterium]
MGMISREMVLGLALAERPAVPRVDATRCLYGKFWTHTRRSKDRSVAPIKVRNWPVASVAQLGNKLPFAQDWAEHLLGRIFA